jgi:16S rRNA (cytosine967-C5)-methyltransferase
MAPSQKSSARSIALTVLNQAKIKSKNLTLLLNKHLPKTDEKPRATDLVMGTIRNQLAIDMIITKAANCQIDRIQKKLLNIIRLAAYELIYTPKTPDHAIVNEAVNITAKLAGKKQTGFVNACLRQITRLIDNRQTPIDQAQPTNILPQNTATGCLFKTDILPDPEKDPTDYYSAAFSLPKWLIADWLGDFGEEKLKDICFASNRKPSIYARVNPLKTTADELAEKFQQIDLEFSLIDESTIQIKPKRSITELPGFEQGLFTIQDCAAAKAVKLLKPKPNWNILDLCAAPGGKTIQLAETTLGKANIIATDIDNDRLQKIHQNIDRLGFENVTVIQYGDLQQQIEKTGPFDCILLDVPCSNTGVLAKRPEVRYRINEKAIKSLAKTQTALLARAAKILKPAGTICYSTCSIQSAENDFVIKHFLRANSRFTLKEELLTLPSACEFDHDGGYIAIMTAE